MKRTNTYLAVLFLLALTALLGVTLLSGKTIAAEVMTDLRAEGQSLAGGQARQRGCIGGGLHRGTHG